METVLSVISALEGATITKEQLEATRLAKYINQLRRRTNCENLARRAKSLLKRWREMVGIQHQQINVNESSVSIATSSTSARPVTSTVTSSTVTASHNMPVTDNAVSTSHLANPQFSQQHFPRHQFNKRIIKQHQSQPYSQPTSPLNLHEKSNPNEFVISVSNPAPATNLSKSSNTSVRKKKKLDKTLEDEKPNIKQQPTSFANLLTGLGYGSSSSFSSTRKSSREKSATSSKPLETFVIEHSSNSNSDIICLPSNTTLSSNITSATNVPPIIIDLQDTNSSMTSLVSKDVTNAVKQSSKKSKKEKKRKDMSRQSQPLQDCDDNNATTASYHRKRQPEMLSVDEKSHSACPTICNISGMYYLESNI